MPVPSAFVPGLTCGPHSRGAESAPGAYLIEAITARDDISPVMARIRKLHANGHASARRALSQSGPVGDQFALGFSGMNRIGTTD